MTEIAISKRGVYIRLTAERWGHIVAEHEELAGMRQEVLVTVWEPERIVEGQQGELLAIREVLPGKFLAVVYRELHEDGFIITAFLTRRAAWLNRRKQIWPT